MITEKMSFFPVPPGDALIRAYLRPLQTPIWDVEIYSPEFPAARLEFLKRPQGSAMQCVADIKTARDTPLRKSQVLVYPHEFSVLGFKVHFERGIPKEDEAALINGGVFHFGFEDRPDCADIPLEAFPDRSGIGALLDGPQIAELAKLLDDPHIRWNANLDAAFREALKSEPYWKFNIGKSALKIKPPKSPQPDNEGQRFGDRMRCWIDWNVAPKVSKPTRVMVLVIGLWWKEL